MGLVLSGCPFALEDDFFIDPAVGVTAPAPAVVAPVTDQDAAVRKEAAPPGSRDACAKIKVSPEELCLQREYPKMP